MNQNKVQNSIVCIIPGRARMIELMTTLIWLIREAILNGRIALKALKAVSLPPIIESKPQKTTKQSKQSHLKIEQGKTKISTNVLFCNYFLGSILQYFIWFAKNKHLILKNLIIFLLKNYWCKTNWLSKEHIQKKTIEYF